MGASASILPDAGATELYRGGKTARQFYDEEIGPRCAPSLRALGMWDAEIWHLYGVFRRIDVDWSGTLSIDELCAYLVIPRSRLSESLVGLYDLDGSGELDFLEFSQSVWDVVSMSQVQLHTWAFRLMDSRRQGVLSFAAAESLLKLIHSVDPHDPLPRAVASVLKAADEDGNGILSQQEWNDLCRRFPVLLKPAFSLQRTVRRRLVSKATWRRLQLYRSQHYPLEFDARDALAHVSEKALAGVEDLMREEWARGERLEREALAEQAEASAAANACSAKKIAALLGTEPAIAAAAIGPGGKIDARAASRAMRAAALAALPKGCARAQEGQLQLQLEDARAEAEGHFRRHLLAGAASLEPSALLSDPDLTFAVRKVEVTLLSLLDVTSAAVAERKEGALATARAEALTHSREVYEHHAEERVRVRRMVAQLRADYAAALALGATGHSILTQEAFDRAADERAAWLDGLSGWKRRIADLQYNSTMPPDLKLVCIHQALLTAADRAYVAVQNTVAAEYAQAKTEAVNRVAAQLSRLWLEYGVTEPRGTGSSTLSVRELVEKIDSNTQLLLGEGYRWYRVFDPVTGRYNWINSLDSRRRHSLPPADTPPGGGLAAMAASPRASPSRSKGAGSRAADSTSSSAAAGGSGSGTGTPVPVQRSLSRSLLGSVGASTRMVR